MVEQVRYLFGLLSQGTTVELKENKSDSYGELRDRANIGIMPISVESSNQLEVQQTPAISEVSPIIKDIEIVKTFSCAGIRPIGASNLKIAKTMDVMGIRPIGTHTIDIVDSINECGIRPITSKRLSGKNYRVY
ncbi:hypothetical protein [Fischerella thermalis]|uniref:hypothetical protein n=1 Tax=Fischerella thermalis TaxID=372787 RepID=UPI001F48B648|nr:hypothetical protein [Fischerella thermalis]